VSRVQDITAQLRTLSAVELRELRAWLDAYEDQIWDEQFAAAVAAGKWDERAGNALRDHRDGRSKPL
jgi:hypothetical protein